MSIKLNKPRLRVLEMHTQEFVGNLKEREVWLDIYAIYTEGKVYNNIEIQRSNKGAGHKRTRFNSSILDARFMEKGKDFNDLPETYVVFITEKDVMKKSLPLYHVERCVMGTGDMFNDEAHILYVNGENRDDTPLGWLMHNFACKNPKDMHTISLETGRLSLRKVRKEWLK